MPTPKPAAYGQIVDWKPWGQGGDEFTDYAIKGEWAPVWKTSSKGQMTDVGNQIEQSQAGTQKTAGGFSGVDYGYFTNMLKSMMSSGDPNQGLYRQNIQGNINKTYDKSADALKERLAGSGLLRSGVGTSGFAGIEGGRAGAIGQAEVGLAEKDQAFREGALNKLLGLQSLGLQELGSNRQYNLSLQELLAKLLAQKDAKDAREDDSSAWGNIFGQALNAGATVGAAAISDRRLKENITKVGISPSGINIYDFNYIGNPKRFRGVMADEVPWASDQIHGIKFVDYSKTDVNFEAL